MMQIDRKALYAPDPRLPGFTLRARHLLVKAGMALSALGLGAIIIATPGDGASESSHPSPEASVQGSTAATPTSRPFPRRTASPTASPAPSPTQAPPADASAGGDQPSTGPIVAAGSGIPENVNASPEFLALSASLAKSVADYDRQVGGIDVAIAVTDLQNGQTISVSGNVSHRTGCVINLFGLLAAVGEFQAGTAAPGGMAFSIKKGIGGSYPPEVKNFLQRIFGSHVTGVYRAREQMRSWGMSASYFDHVPYYGGEPYAPNILTALETNETLTKLWRGQLFDPQWTAYTIGVMRDSFWYTNYILPGRLPAQAKVGHKIGYYADWDGWVNNDAGIVSFKGADGQEKAYAITYMSQMARTEAIGYSFGAKLSKDVWDWMSAKYGLYAPPTPVSTPVPPPPPTPAPTPAPTPTPSPSPTTSPSPSTSPTPSPASSAMPTPN